MGREIDGGVERNVEGDGGQTRGYDFLDEGGREREPEVNSKANMSAKSEAYDGLRR